MTNKQYVIPSDCMIWMDTCCFMEYERMELFLKRYTDEINANKITIYILPGVRNELEKHSHSNDKEKKEKSQYALNHFLNGDYSFFEMYGEEMEQQFADNAFQYIFTKLRLTEKLFFITQDINLGKDILDLNNTRSVNGQKIKVFKISYEGVLEPIKHDEGREGWLGYDTSDGFGDTWDADFEDDIDVTDIVNVTVNNTVYGNRQPTNVKVSKDKKTVTYESNGSSVTITTSTGSKKNKNMKSNIKNALIEGDVTEDMNDDFRGVINGDILGNINCNIQGQINGDILGSINGTVSGEINGDIMGSIYGTVEGIVNGDVMGKVYGELSAKVTGIISGK